jgi:hypothetical protein
MVCSTLASLLFFKPSLCGRVQHRRATKHLRDAPDHMRAMRIRTAKRKHYPLNSKTL